MNNGNPHHPFENQTQYPQQPYPHPDPMSYQDGFQQSDPMSFQDGFQQPAPPYQNGFQQPTPPYQNGFQQPTPPYQNGFQQPTPPYQNGFQQPTPSYQNGFQQPGPYQQPPYGQRQPYQQRPALRQEAGPGSRLAMIGMVMAILSIPAAIASGFLFFLGVYSLIIDGAALILGIVGLAVSVAGGTANIRAGFVRGGASIAGMVCGIVGVALATIMFSCTGCATIAYCNAQNTLKNIRLR